MTIGAERRVHKLPHPWPGKRMTGNGLQPLTGRIARHFLLCFSHLDGAALAEYRVRRRTSSYPDAQADLDVYDANGKLVASGREFRTVCYFWERRPEKTHPSWYEEARPFEPPHRKVL